MSDRHVNVEMSFPSDLSEARRIQADLVEALQSNGYGESHVFAIRLAVEEALANAIKHGNQMDPGKHVHVTYTVTADRFDIRISDEGPGFNPTEVPDPTADENIERPCGRGVYIIRNVMTTVDYIGKGNVVVMTKLRGDPE